MILKCSFNFLVCEVEYLFICLRAIYLSFYVNHLILFLYFCSFSYWFERILYILSKLVLLSMIWAANISLSLPFVCLWCFLLCTNYRFLCWQNCLFLCFGILCYSIFSAVTYKFIILLFYIYLNTIDSYRFILVWGIEILFFFRWLHNCLNTTYHIIHLSPTDRQCHLYYMLTF